MELWHLLQLLLHLLQLLLHLLQPLLHLLQSVPWRGYPLQPWTCRGQVRRARPGSRVCVASGLGTETAP